MNAPPKKPFGTTDVRTVSLTRKDAHIIPGPGAYEGENSKSSVVPSKPSFSFPTASKRFPCLPNVLKVRLINCNYYYTVYCYAIIVLF